MSVRRHLGFGSTPNFPNLLNEVSRLTDNSGRLAYANYDPSLAVPPTEEQKELLQNYKPKMPVLTFIGSKKLHGENMAVCYSQGELWVQGRNNIRTLLDDQNGMASFVDSTKNRWAYIFEEIVQVHNIDSYTNAIVIDCEWAGGNIQKGNAACSGTDKGAYIFDYFRVVNNDTDESQSYSTTGLTVFPDDSIYLMSSFDRYEAALDFNNPTKCEETLNTLALQIEGDSSIAKYFDKPDNVGEGAYLWCEYNGTMLRLKAKGDKHGGKPKVKKDQNPITEEHTIKLVALADKVTPVWRITQAITETNSTEMKHVNEVMKWVIQDIAKEEMPVLHDAGIELKELNKYVTKIVKDYYIDLTKKY
jgi:hypothetical protein